MRHSGYVRNFESTLRLLCDRGHTVHLVFQIAGAHALLDSGDITQELCDTYPRFTRGAIPTREDAWGLAARDLRFGLDYLRYLTPTYRNAPKLLARAKREAPPALVSQTERGLFRTAVGRASLSRGLRAEHQAVPTDPRIDGFLEAQAPDVMAVTPLIEPGAPQAEYIRSARALGIRTALCVASWDNLTNKGLIHGDVDLVTVWNAAMKQEAVELHGVPAERVAITGAQPFDHWFEWKPKTTCAEFCRRVGLPADRAYVLYLCSSRFIAPEEASFVRAWLRELRQAAPPPLRGAGVLIRPHPQHAEQWRGIDLSEFGPVSVWPAAGQVPADAASRAEYFDSMYHGAAVVAVNTTAEIESAIIGRSVLTMLAPEFRDTQEGTLHFRHLQSLTGGLVHVAGSFAEHFSQLDAAVRNPHQDEERCRLFVEAFVRPFGADVPATPKLVEALETLARTPARQPARAPVWASMLRPRVQRHGERLLREQTLASEKKAARRAAKAPKERVDHTPVHWRQLAMAFRALGYEDRVRFGQVTIDCLPGELLLENARPERLDYPDADIYLRVLSKAERERLKACAKEPFTVEWIHRWVQPGDVLYDIGANVGAYSLVAARKPGGGARVFAFEPGYANLSSLCANIVLNQAADLITPLPIALAGTTGLDVFGLRALEPGRARHTLGSDASDADVLYRQPVMTFRLDELIERFGLPAPNHIKLDVDGGELAVLEGAARALALPSLRSMLVEVSTASSTRVTNILTGCGLALDTKIDVENKAGERLVWYGLFTRVPQPSVAPHDVQMHVVSR